VGQPTTTATTRVPVCTPSNLFLTSLLFPSLYIRVKCTFFAHLVDGPARLPAKPTARRGPEGNKKQGGSNYAFSHSTPFRYHQTLSGRCPPSTGWGRNTASDLALHLRR